MREARLWILVILVLAGAALGIAIHGGAVFSPQSANLSPIMEATGQIPLTADRLVTRLINVDELDEKELGNALRSRMSFDEGSQDTQYLSSLATLLTRMSAKKFTYSISVQSSFMPNACALPGGNIIVTTALLETLKSESELVSVLAHEMGHIELGHCMQAAKFELAARKIKADSFGKIADFVSNTMFRITYSKTAEDESDQFSFSFLQQSAYDPEGTAAAFRSLLQHYPSREKPGFNPMREYLSSHPPLQLRVHRFEARADEWWQNHSDMKRYRGRRNLSERRALHENGNFLEEWVQGVQR